MRRLLVASAVLAAAAAALALALPGGDGEEGRRYTIELDNAFGMVEGGDVRVAGVNAGSVADVRLDERTLKALVEVEIDEQGFGSLRADAFCESRPQSPLGEYFLDCEPGTAKQGDRARRPRAGEPDGLHDPAGPDPEHHAPALPASASG